VGLGIWAGLAAGALWGLVFVVPRMLAEVSALDHANGRFIAYGLVAVALMLARQSRWPNAAQWRAALALSALGFGAYYLLLAWAIQLAGTELPSLIIGTIPIAVMLLGKSAAQSFRALLPGLLLTAAGIGVMAWAGHGGTAAPRGQGFGLGLMLAVAAMASWTAFSLLNARYLSRHPELNATDWANWLGLATGALSLVAACAALAWTNSSALLHPTLGPAASLSSERWWLFVALCIATGFGSSWLATVLWNVASQRLSPSLCGQLIVSETLFALAYSFAWDGTLPNAWQALAAALFTAGILASVRAHR
jgi:drug/metabolite transporter (DMT)-like permease